MINGAETDVSAYNGGHRLGSLRSPWTREWREVAELYRAQMRERERRERKALAAGIQCRPRGDAK